MEGRKVRIELEEHQDPDTGQMKWVPVKAPATKPTPAVAKEASKPKNKPVDKPAPKAAAKPKSVKPSKPTCFKGAGWGCVGFLRAKGYCVPQSANGLAKTIPVASKTIKEGEVKVAVTFESFSGHVVAVKKKGKNLIAVTGSLFGDRTGRIVPWSLVKGFTT